MLNIWRYWGSQQQPAMNKHQWILFLLSIFSSMLPSFNTDAALPRKSHIKKKPFNMLENILIADDKTSPELLMWFVKHCFLKFWLWQISSRLISSKIPRNCGSMFWKKFFLNLWFMKIDKRHVSISSGIYWTIAAVALKVHITPTPPRSWTDFSDCTIGE